MSTRFTRTKTDPNAIATGYEGNNVATDEEIPSCTIEDVDRALFNLFNKELPLFYETQKEQKRVPVIFATGERFAILRRKKPLRDKAGSLILPLISIMRTGVDQKPALGMAGGQTQPMVVKKRLSKKDSRYQELLNKKGLLNQDNLRSNEHFIGTVTEGGPGRGAKTGTIASRRSGSPRAPSTRRGEMLVPELGANIIEVITLPPVKYFQASYEITFWTQYTQQMNDMLTALMVSSQWYPGRTFRVETEKGYWFVAYLESPLTSGNNFDDFTDDERIVRYSFNVQIPGYVVAPSFPGAQNPLRKFISAPEISFDMTQTSASPSLNSASPVPSGDPGSYILQDLFGVSDPLPGNAVGSSPIASALSIAGSPQPGGATGPSSLPGSPGSLGSTGGKKSSRGATTGGGSSSSKNTSAMGGQDRGGTMSVVRMVRDPFTGKETEQLLKIKSANQKKGETVYREGVVFDLGKLIDD